MWMIANRAEIPPLEQVQAASKQVNAVILGNNFVTQKDDKQKQIIAETLIYETMLALGMRSKAINSGDLAFMNELADAAYQNLLKQNIDLRALNLTSQGFIYN